MLINISPEMPQIPGLDHGEQDTLDRMIMLYRAKLPRNILRSRYYDSHTVLKDYGISIPPQMKQFETVVGWPAKAVDALARRCKLDGFLSPGGVPGDPLGIQEMADENCLEVEVPQALTSALIHSCAFVATTLGDTSEGEPEVLINMRSALNATALWNPRKRALESALSVVSWRDQLATGRVLTDMVLYMPDKVIEVYNDDEGKWVLRRTPHSLGHVPVAPLPYRPRLERWAGSSRISRAVMSITDEAVRTVLRTEVSAEFYSSPQRYILGADPEAFTGSDGRTRTGWEQIIGQMTAISRDDEGNIPTVGTFAQMSMEPHIAHLRAAATRFAGETNLPVSSMGIVQDNPASAQSIEETKEELINDAEEATVVFGHALATAVRTGLMLRDNLTEMPPEFREIKAKWRDPRTPSRSAAGDYMLKTVQAFPWMADNPVALEQLGWDQGTIDRALQYKAAHPQPVAPPAPNPPVAEPKPPVAG